MMIDPMQEFFSRQMEVLRASVESYRGGNITLNTLIQRIEAIGNVIARDDWKNSAFPIILSMEQVNASSIEAKENLTAEDKNFIEGHLVELEHLIEDFEAKSE